MSAVSGGAPAVELGDVLRVRSVTGLNMITAAENTNGFIITWMAFRVASANCALTLTTGQRLFEGSTTSSRTAGGGHGYAFLPPGVGLNGGGNEIWIMGRFL